MANAHDKADALDTIRTELRLPLRQIERRMKTSSESYYLSAAAEAERTEDTSFNHIQAAKDAVARAKNEWLGISLPAPLAVVEA